MSAPVRIDAPAFADLRYDTLAAVAGLADADHARGKMARLWQQCTARQQYILTEVMVKAVLGPDGIEALEAAELGERTDSGVRIKGTDGRIEWLGEYLDGVVAGGKARAATAERDASGRMMPRQNVKSPAPSSDNPADRRSDVFEAAEKNATDGVTKNATESTNHVNQEKPASPASWSPAGPAGPAPSSALTLSSLLLLGGDSAERCITVSQLNKGIETSWSVSIPPKWYPGFEELEPFSPREIRSAVNATESQCKRRGGRPSPGLLLVKLKDGRIPAPTESEAQQARRRELAQSQGPPRRRSTYKPPEGKAFETSGAPAREIIENLAKGKAL